MNTTVLILLILVIIYVPLWFYVWRKPSAFRNVLEKYGPTIKINSKLGLRFMDRFGRYKRFWRAFGVFSQIVSFILPRPSDAPRWVWSMSWPSPV